MNDSNRVRGRSATLLIAAWLLAACGSGSVDPELVGTWQIPGPGGSWRLVIDGEGHYVFTNGGVGAAPSHRGAFTAHDGEWALRDETGGVEDHGTYELVADALQLAGNRGSLRWGRAAPPPPAPELTQTPPASAGAAAPIAAPSAPSGNAPAASPAAVQTAPPRAVAAAPASAALPDIIDPCSLVTPEEAGVLLDAAVTTKRTTPQPKTQNDCLYRGAGRTFSVTSFNGGGLDTAGYLEQRRARGAEPLTGIGDGAYLSYQAATGLVSVDFVIEHASFQLLVSGVSRERADPALRQLAAQAASRLRSTTAAFQIPGTEGFVGTWLVRETASGSARTVDLVFWVERDGRLRLLTTGGFSGTLVLQGTRWRIEDPFNATPVDGEYRLSGDRLTFEAANLSAQLERVPCKKSPKRVRPPYDLTRDIGGMLSGQRSGATQAPAAGTFDPNIAGLWEGDGKFNGSAAQFLVSIDSRAFVTFALFPSATGRLSASGGKYTLAVEGFGESSGTYQFGGGIADGTIRMEEEGRFYEWKPYDPDRRPVYETPLVAGCR